MKKFLFFIIIAFSLGWLLNPAWAIYGDSEKDFGLDGNFRTIGAFVDNYNFPLFFGWGNDTDGLSQSLLRLIVAGNPEYQKIHFVYEIHAVQSLDATTTQSSGAGGTVSGTGLVPQDPRYRVLDTTWEWLEETHVRTRLFWDRFNCKIRLPMADVTVGRQAITFGKAYFWNPLDVFLPFDPRQFDREYKPGVDAVKIDVPFEEFSGLNLVGVLGRRINAFGSFSGGTEVWDHSYYGSALLARIFATLKDWDVAIQGGKIYGGYQVGGGFSGEMGPIALRGEVAHLFAVDSNPLPFPLMGPLVESATTGVLGFGHRFESSLDVQLEFFFNGAGDQDNFDASLIRFANGGLLNLGEYLAGLVLSYEFLPILTGQFGTLQSLVDGSSQLQPVLRLSLSDEMELWVGANVNLGPRPNGFSPLGLGLRSEFGTYADFYYSEFKIYF